MKKSLNLPFLARISAIAWRNVTRNWRHSLATILAIALGFASVCVFDGFIEDLKSRNEDGYIHRAMLGHVVLEKPDTASMSQENPWKYSISKEEQDFIDAFLAQDPAVAQKMRFLSITGLASSGEQSGFFQGLAIDLESGAEIRKPHWEWNTMAGKPVHLAPPMSLNTGVLMGRTLGCESTYQGPSIFTPYGNYIAAERPFRCEQPRVYLTVTTEAAQVNVIDLKVVGIYDAGFRETDKRSVLMSLKDAQRLFDTDKVTLYAVLLKDQEMSEEFIARIQEALKKAGLSIAVMPWIKHHTVAFIAGGLQILDVFRNLFMTVIVAIGVMAVANTMMKAVNERIREIGTLRSLGFRRSHLLLVFGFEGFYLSLVACFLGFLLTLAITFAVQMSGITFKGGILAIPINLNILYVPVAWAVSFLVLTFLATGTALYSARRAVKMGIADALRHV
jgi:putative ABC transport system permease protein